MKFWVAQVCLAVGIVFICHTTWVGQAQAQDQVWVQIEAHPDLATAESRVRAYAQLVDDVNGFRQPAGWYAVALGPFDRATANARLRDLRAQGLIPRDSYIETGDVYRQQFWPVGANALEAAPAEQIETTPLTEAPEAPETATEEPSELVEETEAPQAEVPTLVVIEETPAEARRSEGLLTREEREGLQIAMQWFGFYTAAIDGAFGNGTRRAMGAWQTAQGYDASGILTTRQRAELLGQYQAELAALGMQRVTDTLAGIEIDLPLAMLEFARYEFPFAQFDSLTDSGVRVLLISQPGDSNTLAGLYEIMQSLEIVPSEGERERNNERFLLTGASAQLRSHTIARLEDGQIKGFSLIWTPERDAQMERVLPMMEQSFSPIAGVLDPSVADPSTAQGINLLAGLEMRTAEISRSGFYVSEDGAVMTSTQALDGQCSRIMIDDLYEADIAYRNDDLGLAVLRPQTRLAPVNFAAFATLPARIRGDIAVAGFPFGGQLGTASLTYGEIADLAGLDGDTDIQRLSVEARETEVGGPVFDPTGAVLGMVLPSEVEGRSLPQGVTFALRGDILAGILNEAGIAPVAAPQDRALGQEALARLGADMTVLVSCWN
ncbi:trypsin-like peptidase domain-containing protein [Rhodophyticola sp. SM2404]